jgi:hypothetical protein
MAIGALFMLFVSATKSIRALLPPGIQPPIIVQFNASSGLGL